VRLESRALSPEPFSFPDNELTAAILAGGRARRLGGSDKGLLRVGGERIIDRQLALARQVAGHHLIVANEPVRYEALGVPVVTDLVRGAGALGGIYTAIMSAPTTLTLVVACDLPFLSLPFLEHLVKVGREAQVDVAIPRSTDGYQPMCALYSRRAADAIGRRLAAGSLKVIDALEDCRVREIEPVEIARFDTHGVLFFNVNTPEDYERANTLSKRC
jgi:molybdopterin-guanine dinucleotide biosynthesis protein A